MGIIKMLQEQVDKKMKEKREKQLSEILKLVDEAKEQNFTYCYYATESFITLKELNNLGFKVVLANNSTDEIRILKISWEE